MTTPSGQRAPEDSVQEAVLDTVRRVLDAPSLTVHDDFFESGGHSLLLIQVIAELRKDHGLSISAKSFLADAQISALAASATVLPSA